MELTQDATSVLTPFEMRQLRKFWAVWSLDRLSQEAKISKTQLSQFENAKNGLTRSQVETCERLLVAAGRERLKFHHTLSHKPRDLAGDGTPLPRIFTNHLPATPAPSMSLE